MAYSATFNFNPNRAEHEEDVYYVRVMPMARVRPTPSPLPRRGRGGNPGVLATRNRTPAAADAQHERSLIVGDNSRRGVTQFQSSSHFLNF